MTDTTITIFQSPEQAADAFVQVFRNAEEAFILAGSIYAKAIGQFGPATREVFASKYPKMSASTWRRLESVGVGALDARLLLGGSFGACCARRLPSHSQKEVLDNGVNVLVAGGDILRVKLDALTSDQAKQVFAGDHVRDPGAQRAWLESRKTPDAPATEGPAATVKNGKVHVSRPCTMTRLDLARLLAEMG